MFREFIHFLSESKALIQLHVLHKVSSLFVQLNTNNPRWLREQERKRQTKDRYKKRDRSEHRLNQIGLNVVMHIEIVIETGTVQETDRHTQTEIERNLRWPTYKNHDAKHYTHKNRKSFNKFDQHINPEGTFVRIKFNFWALCLSPAPIAICDMCRISGGIFNSCSEDQYTALLSYSFADEGRSNKKKTSKTMPYSRKYQIPNYLMWIVFVQETNVCQIQFSNRFHVQFLCKYTNISLWLSTFYHTVALDAVATH